MTMSGIWEILASVFPVESWEIPKNTKGAMYTWPVPVKHDVLEGISQRTGLNGPVSLSLVCDRSTSRRYFTKQVKYRYQCSE